LLPLNVRSDKHFTGHTGKHTAINNALDNGVPIDDIRLTTNNSKEVLQSSYLKKHGYAKKLETSATMNRKHDDEPDVKKQKIAHSTEYNESSQSTTESEIIRLYQANKKNHKENVKPLNTDAVVTSSSTSSSSSSMAQQPSMAGPVFNFYNNCAPNP
jgi:hypothetical protein